MDKQLDIYDENKNLTGRNHPRRQPRADGDFCLVPEHGELLFTDKVVNSGWSCFMDNWLFRQDFDIVNFIPQEGETVLCVINNS